MLSQQEIDNLLADISSGSQDPEPLPFDLPSRPEVEVVTFDFRLPHRISKNQLRTLTAVHESFGETFGSYLVSRLQTTVTVDVVSVDQLFYSEFILSIASPSCLFIFRINGEEAFAAIEFSPQLVLGLVARLLGGTNTGNEAPRLLTQIEQSIVKGIVNRALNDLKRAWRTICEMDFKLERYESEGDFIQIAPPSEIVLVVSLEVTISDQKYLMNMCFPTFALEDVLARLNLGNFNDAQSERHGEWSEELIRKIGATKTQLNAILGETQLTLKDLMELEPGDVLRTNIPIDGEVEIVIGGKPRLWGRPGVSRGKRAAKITKCRSEQQKP